MASSSYGERRQLTIVFSDIVGSTELSVQLDPEDWHDIVTRYHQTAASVVKRYEGLVAAYLGDGVLILFGYPKARENDAERAILAGLAVIEEIRSLNKFIEAEHGKRISVRVGIHTGEVMVRPEEAVTGKIFGETPNIAARVQTEAEPDSVCISAVTQRLVAGFFVVEDLGPHILKGVQDPMQLYRVDRPTGVRSRLHAASKSSLTPYVGRETERNLLMNRWTQTQKGKGQLVMITGEAGIGKSRLLQQFKEDLGGIPHTWVEGESSPYEQDTPFAPTLDLIDNAFQWTADTPIEKKIEELENSFSLVGVEPTRSVPLMASLLGFNMPAGRYPPLLLSPEQQRLQLLQTLVDWLLGTARLQPTVLVIEDLHFADPSTLEEFMMLGEQIEDAQLMLLFTARPKFTPPWPSRPFHTLINLGRLDHENVREMIVGLLGRLIPGETMESLVDRTDGNPLFAEELSQTMMETRAIATAGHQIPATLNDLLMARLDYLGPVKEVAQISSVLGRAFSFSLLSSIADQPQEGLRDALDHLIESGLVFAEKSSTDMVYTFKHALVQEAAYSSLLKSRRRELHRSVAGALEENFPDLAKQRPELVAHHLTEAGDAEKAVEAWQNAGDYAFARAALVEANQHYHKALDVLKTQPDSPDRAQAELPLQISIGHVVSAIKGFGSEEEMKAFSRAREIADQLGDSPQFFFILLGLWGVANSHSEIRASKELVTEMGRIAERDGTSLLLVWSSLTRTLQEYEEANFANVAQWYKRITEYYNPDEHTWAPFDPKVTALNHTALSFWHRGLLDQARQKLQEQFELAQRLSPANVAMSHLSTCCLDLYLYNADSMLENAEAMLKIGEEEQLPSFLAWGKIYRGVALANQGNFTEGIPAIRDALGDYLASGTHSSLGQYLSLLAEAYARAGNVEQALETINTAIGAAPEEKMHFPEYHRVRADILWKQPGPDLDEVERGYREAIKVSQEYGSRMQELRAVIRLGRLLQSRGRDTEAHALLAPLYETFNEGLDTRDLQEAKTLLDELSVTISLDLRSS